MLNETFFWTCLALIIYTYVIYPVILWGCSRVRLNSSRETLPLVKEVSIILVGHREGVRILQKIAELQRQLKSSNIRGEVIVVINETASALNPAITQNSIAGSEVQLILLPTNLGKSQAVSIGVSRAQAEILVFSDVRQLWKEDALKFLVSSFRFEDVGAVSGELVLEESKGITAGVGLYWKYEKWLRLQESKYDSVVGVTGAICAIRRSLFDSVPAGTILDDVYWPMKVVMKGFRVLHVPEAIAYDRLPFQAKDEFRRKVRTLCGNFQLISLLPKALLPWKNRIWWQFLSHKVLRLIVPWALLGAYGSSALSSGKFYQWAFCMQSFLYGITLLGMITGKTTHSRVISAAAAFLLLNFAAGVAFWVWILGREATTWKPVTYDEPVGSLQNNTK
jgi:cellulose synthase/poly-beta-1,6-N-acetylglucosamine synthase-like glycosyltransferase